MPRLLNVIYTVLTRNMNEGEVKDVDDLLWPEDLSKWGESEEAQHGQELMMELLE